MLDAEAHRLCGAGRYERNEGRQDRRAGSYERALHTKAGEVKLKVPKLRRQTFEMAIIERYRRRESSVEPDTAPLGTVAGVLRRPDKRNRDERCGLWRFQFGRRELLSPGVYLLRKNVVPARHIRNAAIRTERFLQYRKLQFCGSSTLSLGTRQDLNLGHSYPVTSQMNHLCRNLR
nr:transposase [Phyllobacterium salinisoli]